MSQVTLNDAERAALDLNRERLRSFEEFIGPSRDQWNEDYRQYRIVRAAKHHYRASPPDRDEVAYSLAEQFHKDIHIPIAYSTIETEVPRTVQNLPTGRVLPDERLADENVQNMQLLVEQQKASMGFKLLAQEAIKDEFLYGLTVIKGPYWKKVVQAGMPYLRRATDATLAGSPWVEARRDRVVYDNAWAEKWDIFDTAWDPFGFDRHTLRWFGTRSWRDGDYVADQLGLTPGREMADRSQAVWGSDCAQQLTAEDIDAIATGGSQMDGTLKDRLSSAGHGEVKARSNLHEVWEIWSANGDRITILDKEYPVLIDRNPFWHGMLPFHFGRPQTQGINVLHGISEIEPLSELIRELDLIRTLRAKNALLSLMRVFVFDEDAVDREDLEFGPGTAIPVRSDDPKQHLYALEIPEIPFSSYREEDGVKSDLDRTSGIGEAVTGGNAGASTATEANIVSNAAGVRIQGKTERFEDEVVTPFMNQLISVNQQMIVQKDVRVPKPPEPGQIDPRGWEWLTLTPAELQGMMSYSIDRNSMGPRNPQQEAMQSQQLWATLRDHPQVDQTRLLKHYLEGQGVKQPSAWVLPQPMVPPAFVQAMAKLVGDDKVQQVMAMIQQEGGQGG